jgi:hypothetical protein
MPIQWLGVLAYFDPRVAQFPGVCVKDENTLRKTLAQHIDSALALADELKEEG